MQETPVLKFLVFRERAWLLEGELIYVAVKSMETYTTLANLQSLEKSDFLCLIKVCLISFIHLKEFIHTE